MYWLTEYFTLDVSRLPVKMNADESNESNDKSTYVTLERFLSKER
jgi:hypothetical protein